jgi:hypothetical protein
MTLASDHGRYTLHNRYTRTVPTGQWPLHMTVINLYPFHFINGYVTTVLILKLKPPPGSRSGLKYPLELLAPRKLYMYICFQGGDDERGFR